MEKKVLITGGAGFIGSHLCDQLINEGNKVRILDNLGESNYGSEKIRPVYLNPEVELFIGDIRNKNDVLRAIKGIDIVYHFVARSDDGQSRHAFKAYTETNNTGTAILLEVLIENPVEKLIVASSMRIYGEGLYKNPESGALLPGFQRNILDIRRGKWELYNKKGDALLPIPTNEEKPPCLNSAYALSKFDQERMCMITGKAYNFPVVALRLFNVYGTRQELFNSYTGVLALFASRFLNNNPPLILEDGNQIRDFVHVSDVARACIQAMKKEKANGEVFNIGSGNPLTFNKIAAILGEVLNKQEIIPSITRKYRTGDIRHCYADITKAHHILAYTPMVDIKVGLRELSEWMSNEIAYDHFDKADKELEARGLAV